MPISQTPVVRLCELQPNEEATCYAALARKQRKTAKNNKPYWTCTFRDRNSSHDCRIWADSRWFEDVKDWPEGQAFRLVATLENKGFGLELLIRDIRFATESDRNAGFEPAELYPSALRSNEVCWTALAQMIDKEIPDRFVRELVSTLLENHRTDFERIQAATSMHHAYIGGLLEHVWSMTRIAVFLANHYERYYERLDPPLNRSIIVAAAILHDIGKLLELEYRPVEARYTKHGYLIGHIVMGRDMVREATGKIEGFPEETLLLLEHAILAHHRQRQFGSPVEPQTIEALIVSYIDELDAKVNAAALELLKAPTATDDTWTEKVYALENRRLYRGIPTHKPSDSAGYQE